MPQDCHVTRVPNITQYFFREQLTRRYILYIARVSENRPVMPNCLRVYRVLEFVQRTLRTAALQMNVCHFTLTGEIVP